MRAAAALLTLLTTGWAASAHAGLKVTVSPALLEVEGAPGSSVGRAVTFANQSASEVTVSAKAWDWGIAKDGTRKAAPPGVKPDSVVPWFTIKPAQITVPPGGLGVFQVTVSLPPDAAGGYYAQVQVSTRPQNLILGTTMGMSADIAVLVLINAGGAQPRTTARVVEIKPPTDTSKLAVTLELANTGNVHVWAEPTVDLLGPFDDFVAFITPSKQKRILLLPKERKLLRMEWAGELAPSAYEAIASVYYGTQRSTVAGARTAEQVAMDQARFEVGDMRVAAGAGGEANKPPAVAADKQPARGGRRGK